MLVAQTGDVLLYHLRTSIRFDLPSAGGIDLAVFDVAGRRLPTLVSGGVEAGRHEAVWNGEDESGQPAPGGIYFYRPATDGKTLAQMMRCSSNPPAAGSGRVARERSPMAAPFIESPSYPKGSIEILAPIRRAGARL